MTVFMRSSIGPRYSASFAVQAGSAVVFFVDDKQGAAVPAAGDAGGIEIQFEPAQQLALGAGLDNKGWVRRRC